MNVKLKSNQNGNGQYHTKVVLWKAYTICTYWRLVHKTVDLCSLATQKSKC